MEIPAPSAEEVEAQLTQMLEASTMEQSESAAAVHEVVEAADANAIDDLMGEDDEEKGLIGWPPLIWWFSKTRKNSGFVFSVCPTQGPVPCSGHRLALDFVFRLKPRKSSAGGIL